jgi:hypothetical protein
MILVIIALVSLIAIYFTRLFFKKEMKAAALAVALLYIYLIVWTYAVFIIDIADLGFSDSETRLSLLHGSNIYHSFVDITLKTSVIPLGILEAFVVVLAVAVIAGFIVVFHGIVEITKYVLNKNNYLKLLCITKALKFKIINLFGGFSSVGILRLHCRMNC